MPFQPADTQVINWIEQQRGPLEDAVRNWLVPRVQQKVSASDVVQESLITAAQLGQQAKQMTETVRRNWLRQIVKSKLIDTYRMFCHCEKRQIGREERANQAIAAASPRMARVNTVDVKLEQARAGLTRQQQEVLRLRYESDLTFEQIGSQLKISKHQVRRLWAKSIRELSNHLTDR